MQRAPEFDSQRPAYIQFGGRADRGDQIKYANKRAEMWGALRDGLRYLAIPASNELRDQLIGPEYDFNLRGELQLEKKSEMKKRGLQSPDIADALALTYARPVFSRNDLDWLNTKECITNYNPFSNESIWGDEKQPEPQPQSTGRYAAGWESNRLKPELE